MTAQPDDNAGAGPLRAIPGGIGMHGVDLALDAMDLGLFEWDVDTGAYQWSDRCKRIWGFPVECDMSYEMILGRVHPEDLHLSSVVLAALAPEGPGRYSIDHRIVLPDGRIRWVQVAGRTRFIEKGGVLHAVRGYGAMRDITARKEADGQLYERTSQLRAFVEGAPVPIAIFDADMRYLAVSNRYAQDRRLIPAMLIGRTIYEIFPGMPQRWRDVHGLALRGQTQGGDQDQWTMPDGAVEWFRWELHPWYSAPDKVGGAILFAEIITQRLHEQQLLRDSQARLELALHAGAMGVYDRDMTLGTVGWDERLRELFGFGPDEPLTNEMFYDGIHPDDRERVLRMLQEARRGGGGGIVDMEYRVVNRRDGSVRWLASAGKVYLEDHQRIVGVVQDITGRKNTELALARSAAELRRADERKNVYLATLSHELRNPLAPIRTAAHLLASPKLTAEQLVWVAQVVHRQTEHMVSLLEDLMDITRIGRDKLRLNKDLVPLRDIVQRGVESARPLIEERRHLLVLDPPETPLRVRADPHRLSQVLANLLTNAAKYTQTGGRIELMLLDEGDLVIRVRDNGAGIEPQDLGRIFTMFWQAEHRDSTAPGGLGIGLALVEGIVKLHGGTIEARSGGRGAGSELIVRLPVIEHPASSGGTTHAPPGGHGPPEAAGQGRC